MLAEFLIKVWELFASHVFLNKRRLTGNRPGSARRETGSKQEESARERALCQLTECF